MWTVPLIRSPSRSLEKTPVIDVYEMVGSTCFTKLQTHSEVQAILSALANEIRLGFLAHRPLVVTFGAKSLPTTHQDTQPNRKTGLTINEQSLEDCMSILNAIPHVTSLSLAVDVRIGHAYLFPWCGPMYDWLQRATNLEQLALPAPLDDAFLRSLPPNLSVSLTHLCLFGHTRENLDLLPAFDQIVRACPKLTHLGYSARSSSDILSLANYRIPSQLVLFVVHCPSHLPMSPDTLGCLASVEDIRFVAMRVHTTMFKPLESLLEDLAYYGLISARGYGGIFNGTYAPPGEGDAWSYGDDIVRKRALEAHG
ncbi:hypothetical protein CYLTODRAFT_491950 [Cylindrobasidium torrendii FP15055 ss-10]|uniref:F-box domain-containing protein n=1 Tax=Cylindrobasidium torrendii FP15055 ss-10 TaxID=1314674 RepID=A0A0D7B6U0_9AGAR|nr:hypothetical protein CYLTODRAFT_491950 [Cylindrobasidium torrendii FP15055 ss-10]